eukprot:GFUD01122208.1.p1 GENE.GFUD01122208.1~~GFUD01122208.1.p1  ORF type:complete len:504 (+),score=159.74 GFUD01122208.1:58-1569(+)
MMQLDKLRELCSSINSGVTSVKKQIHLALEPSFLSNINLGILKCLNSHLQEYYPEVSGILLGYDDVKLKKSTGSLYTDQPHIHIDIQAIFYVFCPSPGKFLLGSVNKKSVGHVGCLVHDAFNASIICPSDTPTKSWAGGKLVVGQVVRFRVVSVSYTLNRLIMLGELDKVSTAVGEREAMVGIIEEVSDFEGDSEHDSGIENGHKRENKEVSNAVTAPVNGEASGAANNKRKAEETAENETDRKRRRKAEKKARKEKERLEQDRLAMITSTKVDSADEFQSESKHKKKKDKKENSSLDLNFSNVLEPDLQSPQTPKPKEKSSIAVPKTPNTPKDNFVLPDDFKVLEKKTEKKKWKIYQGPDGKNYRSMAEVKRFLESQETLSQESQEILEATIEFVASEWNLSEHGSLAKDKTKFYKSELTKDFPKTEDYFVDIKSKPKQTPKKPLTETPEVQPTSKSAKKTEKNISQDQTEDPSELMEVSATDSMKKKKKKKNKHNNSSLDS